MYHSLILKAEDEVKMRLEVKYWIFIRYFWSPCFYSERFIITQYMSIKFIYERADGYDQSQAFYYTRMNNMFAKLRIHKVWKNLVVLFANLRSWIQSQMLYNSREFAF